MAPSEDICVTVAGLELRLRGRDTDSGDYYWHLFWPAARALGERLVADASEVAGARVLELGAGLGLPGIVAARLGAEVWMNDIDAEALSLTRENVIRNDIAGVDYLPFDWAAPPAVAPFDLILGSELVYEPFCIEPLAITIDRLLAPEGRAI